MSAVDQYVEAIPTSSGPAPTGRSGAPVPLPPRVVSQVREQGGEDADELVAIATSPSHGAPSAPAPRSALTERARPGDVAATDPSPLDAVVTPIADADEPRLLVLLGLLGGTTLAAFALAAGRRRR